VNAAGLLADARETIRLESLRRRLLREQAATRPGRIRRVAQDCARKSLLGLAYGYPLLFVVWPLHASRIFFFTFAFGFWIAVLLRVRLPAPRRDPSERTFGAFELLHAPSRRGLLAASWLRALPWLTWTGGCGVAFVAQRPDVFGRLPALGFVTIGLTPLLVVASIWWAKIGEDQGDWTVRGLALLGLAAATALCVVGTTSAVAGGVSGDVGGWIAAILCAALTWWLGRATRANFNSWRARRRLRGGPFRAAARVAAVLACVAWAVTIFLLLASKADERAATIAAAGWWAAPSALVVVLAAGALFVVEQFVWIDTMQLGAFARKSKVRTWKPTVGRARAGTTAPGAGLWRAQWRRLREEKLSALDSIVYVAISLRGPAFAAVAVTMAAYSAGLGLPWCLAAWTAPRLIDVEDAEIDRLQMFGRDLRDIVRHDLRALLFVAALPTLVAGVVAATVAGWTAPRIATLALIAAGFVLRAGMPGLSRIARRIGRFTAYGAMICWWIGASAAIGWLAPTREFAIEEICAVCIAGPGLLGIACGPLFKSESALRDERRRHAAGVALA
jgi:hypothetical protein